MKQNITISTGFENGGGTIEVIQSVPLTLRIEPHGEGKRGWSQIWWYFSIDGFVPDTPIALRIYIGKPEISGISPKICYSYDQLSWGLTDTGNFRTVDGESVFEYLFTVKGNKVWFAYDFPYSQHHVETMLVPEARQHPQAEVFELCRTRKGRPVHAFRLSPAKSAPEARNGVWLQARAHSFESGTSWVLHELLRWLLSSDSQARALINCSEITVVPIFDVDAVTEGRTGKYQLPVDHWMDWNVEPAYWPEVAKTKKMLTEMAGRNKADLFIDFHGPGGNCHPYFLTAFEEDLPHDLQRRNRRRFFKTLDAKSLTAEARETQSMTRIHYSERRRDPLLGDSSHDWVTTSCNPHSLAFTIEINMNTPLSDLDGYRAEAVKLGRGIAEYFTNNLHQKK